MHSDTLAVPQTLNSYDEYNTYVERIASAFKHRQLTAEEWETRHDAALRLFDCHQKERLLRPDPKMGITTCDEGHALRYKGEKKSPAN